ncbi:SMI1/KNR4 family protein [Stagnimonas aquatica]|uniref:SMI1/KNR4 family protein n=1 Tax=Stagnimonas aquatica TaxID=2689987 RepID=A0A3N0V9W7_9GAMM|nr:SMI1/KNR4 family protein [Stagnimonas aquatica]ROH89401.1 SMI1/KNR4 family protein [Stagnimonas aquatica]
MSVAWVELLTAFCLAAGEQGAAWKARPPQWNEPATEEQIHALEKTIGVELPGDYKDFLRTSNGIRNYVPGADLPGTEDLKEFVISRSHKYGTYAKAIRDAFLYDDEIGFGIQDDEVLMIYSAGGSSGAIFLVVSPKSRAHGNVVVYLPGEPAIYPSWLSYMGSLTEQMRKSR